MERFLFDEFDPDESERRKREAMDRVERNASMFFKLEARNAVYKAAKTKDFFTTDDAWRLIPAEVRIGIEPRAMGPVMVNCAKAGWCRKTNETRKSDRVECHRRPLTVWKSLIYGE